jgi:hypothetical protein
MAFSAADATDSSRMRRALSLGPIKMQALTFTCVSTDTSGTVTCDQLSEVSMILIDGLIRTTADTISGNVVTLAFNAPGGTTVAGNILAFGI